MGAGPGLPRPGWPLGEPTPLLLWPFPKQPAHARHSSELAYLDPDPALVDPV